MRRIFIGWLALVMLSGCATLRANPEYTTGDKIAAGLFVVATAVDIGTTIDGIRNRGAREVVLDPILGERPSNEILITFGTAKIALMFSALKNMDHKWRKVFFISGAILSAGASYNNHQVGR